MDREAWWATVHAVTKSRTRLSNLSAHSTLCYEHCYAICLCVCVCVCVCVNLCFHFSWVNIPRSGIAGSYGNSVFNFLRKCQTLFPKSLYHFTYLQTVYEGFIFSTSL